MENSTVLHVGLAKAASTTLQGSLFPGHPEIDFLGKPHDERLNRLVVYACWGDYDEFNSKLLTEYYEQEIIPRRESQKHVVASNEALTQMGRLNRKMVAERMCTLFGDCRILVILRNQRTWLESMYMWEFKAGVRMSFDEYLAAFWKGALVRSSCARILNYASLTQSYADVFGEANIGVFLFEDLVRDRAVFARDLCRFIGVDEEAGVAALGGTINKRRLTKLDYHRQKYNLLPHTNVTRFVPGPLHRWAKKLIGDGDINIKISASWAQKIDDAYRESNRRVGEKYGLPLTAYGYPT